MTHKSSLSSLRHFLQATPRATECSRDSVYVIVPTTLPNRRSTTTVCDSE